MARKHILIVGDSWADPRTLMGDRHTADWFLKWQHRVYVRAQGACSNRDAFRLVKGDPPSRVDWIIWFQTEAFRDFHAPFGESSDPWSYDTKLEEIYTHTYREFEQLRSHYGSRVILIGGQSAIQPYALDIIQGVRHTVWDWRAELLAEHSLAQTHTLCHPQLWNSEGIQDKHSVRHQLLRTDLQWIDLMEHSPLFPDNCHPGAAAHAALARSLRPIIDAK